MAMMDVLEWWPDYGGVLLHLRAGPGGQPVDVATLRLSDELLRRLQLWVARYADDKLPSDDHGDLVWLGEGVALLGEVRRELATRYRVVVTEPWWGEPPICE